jgi:hypothetical protein
MSDVARGYRTSHPQTATIIKELSSLIWHPARYARVWGITPGVRAHAQQYGDIPSEPVARLWFTDALGVRWHRAFDGTLSNESAEHESDGEAAFGGRLQAGDLSSLLNPVAVAIAFLSALSNAADMDDLRPLLAPSASGWDALDDDGLKILKAELSEYGVASHVW